jgi:hypothetical protein
MNKYRKRYQDLISLRMSASERLLSFVIGFFGDGFGLVGACLGVGGLGFSLVYYFGAAAGPVRSNF